MKLDKTFIIAEAGVNHNGNINLAKKLIDIAVQCKVDAVKFQTFKSENLVTKEAPKAEYQKSTTGDGKQFDMLKKLELTLEDHIELKNYCKEKNILLLSTPFDFESVDLLEKINMSLYKISSGDLTNVPLLEYISKKKKPIILSTGMANLDEIEEAIETIKSTGNEKIYLLHCTSNYPTRYEDVNLKAMTTMKETFKLPVGYSDHTLGIEVAIAAVAMGAKIIEKHFTIDKNMNGPDHKASLSAEELKNMVIGIRNVEKSFGDGIKRCNESEENTKKVARKSIVASRDIEVGKIISEDDLSYKRPECGLKPKYNKSIIGKKANRDIKKDDIIYFDSVK